MMPRRMNSEVPPDWRAPPAPTRQATEVNHTEIPAEPPQEPLPPKREAAVAGPDHDAFPVDPPRPRRETNADVGVNFDAPDEAEAEAAQEPAAKKRRTGVQIAIPYAAAEDPEEHRKQKAHILACVAQAAIEMIKEGIAEEKTETEAEDSAEAKPKTIELTVAGNFFPDTKTGKVHVRNKTE